MQGLNYHHLLYFWMVAREGSITRAGEVLEVAQPTISGQLHALESSLGEDRRMDSPRHLAEIPESVGEPVHNP